LEYTVPTTVFVTALSAFLHPNLSYTGSGVERITTYFVDPLTFGSICLALAMFSLVSINAGKVDPLWLRVYKLCGFFFGLYMSFISGSRTGWMAIPVILWMWLRFRKNFPHWLIFLSVFAFCLAVYFLIPVVTIRVDLGVHQFLHYHWNAMNSDDPIESRIAFSRIGWFVFEHNPLGGWGDKGFKCLLDAPELKRFAPESTRYLPYQAGFHNEVVTNMVRSGIWGLMSSLALFFVPISLFVNGLRSQSALTKNHALIGISYMLCILVSAMSTEVFNLKFTAAFHAFMIASLTASFLVLTHADSHS
jgi:O-antigen ligase